MPISVGDRLGPYEIVSRLGAGGMGEVWRARDPRLGRDVAVKISAEQFSERFEREARAIAALNHPNICTLYDVGPNYLVMELIEGSTLADRIAQGPVPLNEALDIAGRIAEALEAAHEKGIVHRDLKPANIKVTPQGQVKVLDFGLAKAAGEAPAGNSENSPTLTMRQTQLGVILGTAGYMAPEQARGWPVDKRADIWAYGVVLWEMLTGKPLFGGESITDVLAAVVKTEPDWMLVPERIRPLLQRCLEKDPKRRLRDIGDTSLLLEREAAAPPAHRSSGWWRGWAAAAALVLILLPGNVLYFREKAPAPPAPVRFQVLTPEKSRLTGMALSPDGCRLAIEAVGTDGHRHIWIRSFDSLDAQLLPHTEDIANPIWSPDDRFLAFYEDGKLKMVEANGGSPQVLCDAPGSGRGGAWNRDGVIIFGAGAGLKRVAVATGECSSVTSLDATRQETRHARPWFLPDGRHFLYLVLSNAGQNSGIYLGSLDGTPAERRGKRLMGGQIGALYAPSPDPNRGYVLFLRDAMLMAQPFNQRELRLESQAVVIGGPVGDNGIAGQFSVSANGVLAFAGAGPGISALTWYDRLGKPQGTIGEPAAYRSLSLSPDGTRVAADRAEPGGTQHIWLYDLARDVSTRLTFGQTANAFATWSPDGNRIVFVRSQNESASLYETLANGASREQRLTDVGEGGAVITDWSHDGRFLLYSTLDSKTKSDVWVLPLAGERKAMPVLQTEFYEGQGRFSPDTRWIAYSSDESGRFEVYVRAFPPGSGGKFVISNGGGTQPRWRGDGKELFYLSGDKKFMAVDVTPGAAFLVGVPRLLFEAPLYGGADPARHRWDVTADGKKFLINTDPMSLQVPINIVLNWQSTLVR